MEKGWGGGGGLDSQREIATRADTDTVSLLCAYRWTNGPLKLFKRSMDPLRHRWGVGVGYGERARLPSLVKLARARVCVCVCALAAVVVVAPAAV